MATSESDDFESADEEMNDRPTRRHIQQWKSPTTIGSDSDDDVDFIPRQTYTNTMYCEGSRRRQSTDTTDENRPDKTVGKNVKNEGEVINIDKCHENVSSSDETASALKDDNSKTRNPLEKESDCKRVKLGPKKLGTKITQSSDLASEDVKEKDVIMEEESLFLDEFPIKDEITESEMPEEMKSDKTFKEVFKTDGWEDDIELPKELLEEKLQPILKNLSLTSEETENSATGWGWANWGVTSLINTASAGVSTLTSHVSQGLTMLEESMAMPDEPKSITNEEEEKKDGETNDDKKEQTKEQSSFGFGNLISGVSSITKLVESTGSKVMSGGLDTLEAIGKKTMEVLQEGDPGLKKKRAFFTNETDKPNLSHILREAKEKAEANQKTIEEKQKLRKVHFESLFDDYQGLVHLEALEILSKQCNIKIQQHLSGLDSNELDSVQKMLEEVQELCDLGDEEEEADKGSLENKLQEACSDLAINIMYDKLHKVCEDSKTYTDVTHNDREIFEHAISVLAQFTAFSVERFHKTAELLLVKEHRSTVNEADSLVRLTLILSKEIEALADTYCSSLNKIAQTLETADDINANITTIFMEASNASSYIQDAFKLLIPIIQVGAL